MLTEPIATGSDSNSDSESDSKRDGEIVIENAQTKCYRIHWADVGGQSWPDSWEPFARDDTRLEGERAEPKERAPGALDSYSLGAPRRVSYVLNSSRSNN